MSSCVLNSLRICVCVCVFNWITIADWRTGFVVRIVFDLKCQRSFQFTQTQRIELSSSAWNHIALAVQLISGEARAFVILIFTNDRTGIILN